jgi:hypothetical protein
VGVTGDPLPMQSRAIGFEKRFGADDGEIFDAHECSVGFNDKAS